MTSVSELQSWLNSSLSSKWFWVCLWAWTIAGIMFAGIIGVIAVLASVLMMWQGMSDQAATMHAEAMKEVTSIRNEIHQTVTVPVRTHDDNVNDQLKWQREHQKESP